MPALLSYAPQVLVQLLCTELITHIPPIGELPSSQEYTTMAGSVVVVMQLLPDSVPPLGQL